MSAVSNRNMRKALSREPVVIFLGVMVFLLCILGGESIYSSNAIDSEVSELYRRELTPLAHIKDVDNGLVDMERDLKRLLLSQNPEQRAQVKEMLERTTQLVDQQVVIVESSISRPENQRRFSKFKTLYTEYKKNVDHALALAENRRIASNTPGNYILSADFQRVVDSADRLLDEITAAKEKSVWSKSETINSLSWRSQIVSWVTLLFAASLGLVVGFYVRSASKLSVDNLQRTIEDLSAGNLDIAVPFIERQDRMGVFARLLDRIRLNLRMIATSAGGHERISRALPSDVKSVVQLIVENSGGAFHSQFCEPEHQQALAQTIHFVIRDGYGKRTTHEGNEEKGVAQELWVYRVPGGIAAFAWIQAISKASDGREIESIAVASAYRGKGIGSEMVDFFCQHFAGRDLYMQCKPDSSIMQIARRRGFAPIGQHESYAVLKRPANMFWSFSTIKANSAPSMDSARIPC